VMNRYASLLTCGGAPGSAPTWRFPDGQRWPPMAVFDCRADRLRTAKEGLSGRKGKPMVASQRVADACSADCTP